MLVEGGCLIRGYSNPKRSFLRDSGEQILPTQEAIDESRDGEIPGGTAEEERERNSAAHLDSERQHRLAAEAPWEYSFCIALQQHLQAERGSLYGADGRKTCERFSRDHSVAAQQQGAVNFPKADEYACFRRSASPPV